MPLVISNFLKQKTHALNYRRASSPGGMWEGIDLRVPMAARFGIVCTRTCQLLHLPGSCNFGIVSMLTCYRRRLRQVVLAQHEPANSAAPPLGHRCAPESRRKGRRQGGLAIVRTRAPGSRSSAKYQTSLSLKYAVKWPLELTTRDGTRDLLQ